MEIWKLPLRNNWVSTRPCLCSNISIYKIPWQILKVQPQLSSLNQSLPYLRAFQWGTVWLYLKGYQKYDKPKLKNLNLSNKSWIFNFDLSYFWYPSRHRVIQYLIAKLLNMVKMSQEDKIVAALSTSIRMPWKVAIYYINKACLFSIEQHCK